MTSKEINDLIKSCDLIPGDEGITRRLLMISHALNQRIDDLENSLPVEMQPAAVKPDKNVVVPDYDILTEGYDPAKLKITEERIALLKDQLRSEREKQ